MLQENKANQISRKKKISYPLIRTRTCVMGVFHVFKIAQMVPNRAKHQICCLFFLKRSSIQYLRFLLFSLVIFVTKESVVFLRVHLAKERYLLQMIGLMMETCHWT